MQLAFRRVVVVHESGGWSKKWMAGEPWVRCCSGDVNGRTETELNANAPDTIRMSRRETWKAFIFLCMADDRGDGAMAECLCRPCALAHRPSRTFIVLVVRGGEGGVKQTLERFISRQPARSGSYCGAGLFIVATVRGNWQSLHWWVDSAVVHSLSRKNCLHKG